jgi:cystathionine beta-synthase
VRDIVINRFPEGSMVTIGPRDTLRTAFSRMRAADVSQLPVVEGERIVGLLDESDMLGVAITDAEGHHNAFTRLVQEVMVKRLETVSAAAPIAELAPVFKKDHVAIVMDGDRFLGLATRLDLINYFRIMQR